MEQSRPVDLNRSIFAWVFGSGDFVANIQDMGQYLVPSARGVDSDGIQYSRFADAIAAGEKGDAAQARDGEFPDAAEVLNAEIRE